MKSLDGSVSCFPFSVASCFISSLWIPSSKKFKEYKVHTRACAWGFDGAACCGGSSPSSMNDDVHAQACSEAVHLRSERPIRNTVYPIWQIRWKRKKNEKETFYLYFLPWICARFLSVQVLKWASVFAFAAVLLRRAMERPSMKDSSSISSLEARRISSHTRSFDIGWKKIIIHEVSYLFQGNCYCAICKYCMQKPLKFLSIYIIWCTVCRSLKFCTFFEPPGIYHVSDSPSTGQAELDFSVQLPASWTKRVRTQE